MSKIDLKPVEIDFPSECSHRKFIKTETVVRGHISFNKGYHVCPLSNLQRCDNGIEFPNFCPLNNYNGEDLNDD